MFCYVHDYDPFTGVAIVIDSRLVVEDQDGKPTDPTPSGHLVSAVTRMDKYRRPLLHLEVGKTYSFKPKNFFHGEDYIRFELDSPEAL